MRVWLLADPEIPVPPVHYGGIERVIALHARTLEARGHDVTLFAHPGSDAVSGLAPWPGARAQSRTDTLANTRFLFDAFRRAPVDDLVIHSFARLAYMAPLLPRRVAVIQSYQRRVTPRSVVLGHVLSRGRLQFTACSGDCAARGSAVGNWHVVYNNVDVEHYRLAHPAPGAPLMFLGRIERIKGPQHAIEVARRSGRELILAGNLPDAGPDAIWARELLRDAGPHVRYVGPVDDAQKNSLLGQAAALLMPIDWDEPFGIVMAEALACGTPVIGFRRGSVPEVIEHRRTGFVCQDLEGMVAAVERIPEIDRTACRVAAEKQFSAAVIAESYERVYAAAQRAHGR